MISSIQKAGTVGWLVCMYDSDFFLEGEASLQQKNCAEKGSRVVSSSSQRFVQEKAQIFALQVD